VAPVLPLLPPLLSLGIALQLTSADLQVGRTEVSERDSIRALREARRAQDDFERIRRWSSPRTFDRPPAPCEDQIIGRICHWYGDTAETQPPEEPDRIVRARGELLEKLSRSASVASGDDWVAGQRVRYLVESGDVESAVTLGRRCEATRWWCDALLGFALHAAQRYEAADSAYASALARMPEKERCEWEDLSVLLDDRARRAYDDHPCTDRAAENARIWWLADPFFAVPGNDRRTEHFARLTMSRMQEQAWNAHQLSWGDDLEEVTVRYGWSTWFTRGQAPMSAAFREPVTGMSRTPAYHFVPDWELLADARASARGWTISGLDHGKSTREYYAPSYAVSVSGIEVHGELFHRGDSVLVVATYDASDAAPLAGLEVDAALALSPGPEEAPLLVRHRQAERRGVLTARVPWRSMLMSVELLSPAGRRAARAREWIGSDTGAITSGLLLLEASAGTPATLEEALPHVLTRAEVSRGQKVTLYWEPAGASPGDTLLVSLGVSRERAGGLRRLAQKIGLSREWTPIRMSWAEPVRRAGAASGRSLVLDLSGLERGDYVVELRATAIGGETVAASREIRIDD
jgi:hypothetical protein